jgi:hypothetical protein
VPEGRFSWPGAYVALAVVALIGYFLASLLFSVTLPYHQWDSFAYADWSRAIAQNNAFDPIHAGSTEASRPLFYGLEGVIWRITGISFTAGRLFSLFFAAVLLIAMPVLQRALGGDRLEQALVALAVISVPFFTMQALEGQTDVPAAALVATVAAISVTELRTPARKVALVACAVLAVLTKQTTILALAPLIGALILIRARDAARLLAAGLALGLVYDAVMARRFDQGFIQFLRQGTENQAANLADQTRAHAVLRADVLGAGLRLPLIFALAYAIVRLAGGRHRLAVALALTAGLVWSIAGPLAAGVHAGPFDGPENAFAFVGFAVVLSAAVLVPDEDAPTTRMLLVGLALGVLPLLAWVYGGTYTERLAATAWPGLAVLIAASVATGIRGLARGGPAFALAAIPVVTIALWASLANLDGLHGSMWTEYRSLGAAGVWDRDRAMHVVLPAFQNALTASKSQLGDGRLVTADPMFPYFLPGRVDTSTPQQCGDLRGERIFVLLTGDEETQAAQQAHALATPEQWAACTSPKLQQLTDGSNGYAVFVVNPS